MPAGSVWDEVLDTEHAVMTRMYRVVAAAGPAG
jgi:hypothetical protein